MKKLLLGILFIIFAVSCGNNPEAVVSKFIDNVKSKNMEEASKYIADKNAADDLGKIEYNSEEQKLFFETLFKNMKYKIVKTEKKDENISIVTVEVENVDMYKVFLDVFKKRVKNSFESNGGNQIPLEEEFKNTLGSKDVPLTKNTTQFIVVKTKEGNRIQLRPENVDVMLGKFNTALQNLENLGKEEHEMTQEAPSEPGKAPENNANQNEEKKEAPKAEQKQKLEEPK